MKTFMQPQVDVLSEALVTNVTYERFLAAVQPNVGLEVGLGTEALVASFKAAEVRLLSGVNQCVFLKVSKLGETFLALLTLKWSLS